MTTQMILIAGLSSISPLGGREIIQSLFDIGDVELSGSTCLFYRKYLDRWTMVGHDLKRCAKKSGLSVVENEHCIGLRASLDHLKWMKADVDGQLNAVHSEEERWMIRGIHDCLVALDGRHGCEIIIAAKILGVESSE